MTNISKNQIDELKQRMELELFQLVNEMRDEMDPESKLSYVDVGGDGNSGDEAIANTIVDTNNAVIGLHLQKAIDLNAALDRIQSNVYGVCIDCGDDIIFERVTAYPTAKRCFKCQHMREMKMVK
ncbi:TraR/DksA family transcriptional regulator [Methylotenera versatilis]|uniref:TraR/DksA family transcriptional regulator n=1 Tax=Methylotenera versatilis TaxID=1055487 RepID=UPI00064555FA|nr:TraR/DksA C4-type zinc finger protein [Methylotenera versatilis]